MSWVLETIRDQPGTTRNELRAEGWRRFGGRFDVAALHRLLARYKQEGQIESYRVPGTTSEKPHGWRLKP